MTEQTDKLTLDEAVESLTGFDEIAIEKKFGHDITTLLTDHAIRAMRATAFVLKRREGLNDADAYKASMDMTIGQTQDFFADEPDELMPEEPSTELGKDDSAPDEQPMSSPPSAS
jgi:hypothetical protein